MKNKKVTAVKAASLPLPKPYLAFTASVGQSLQLTTRGILGHHVPCLILPMPSKRAAVAKKKWEAMGREQKVEAIAKALYDYTYRQEADQPKFIRQIRGEVPTWKDLSTTCAESGLVANIRGKAEAVLALIEGEPTP